MKKFIHRGPTYLRCVVFTVNSCIYIKKCYRGRHIHQENSKFYGSSLDYSSNLELYHFSGSMNSRLPSKTELSSTFRTELLSTRGQNSGLPLKSCLLSYWTFVYHLLSADSHSSVLLVGLSKEEGWIIFKVFGRNGRIEDPGLPWLSQS